MDKKLVYNLTKKSVLFLFIYYTFILVTGIVICISTILRIDHIDDENLLLNTILASLAASGMFCSMQYVKRLYKACLDERIIHSADGIKNIGNIIYFLLRPAYSFSFVIIVIFAMLSGTIIITNEVDYVLNIRFLYLSVIISSFIGFSVGRVLDKFTLISEEKIDRLSDSQRGK